MRRKANAASSRTMAKNLVRVACHGKKGIALIIMVVGGIETSQD
jgi:hypothetical protein